jgi:subtilisin family serine protease
VTAASVSAASAASEPGLSVLSAGSLDEDMTVAKDPELASALAVASDGQRAASGWRRSSQEIAFTQVLPAADVRHDGLVVVEVVASSRSGLTRALGEHGHAQRSIGGDRWQVAVHPTHLRALAADPAVERVQQRSLFRTAATTSEGAVLMKASARHDVGIVGGVDVAVVDSGFAGWAAAQQAGDLPAPASEMSYCPNVGFRGDDHGTAVAEIIHDMAPAARLHLICIEDDVGFSAASRHIRSKGITIVNASGGFFDTGFGNGREGAGSPWHVVNSDRQAGIFWSVSAGNSGEQHWGGRFVDTDGDRIHDYATSQSLNTVTVPAGGTFYVVLRWDEFDLPRTDMDLFVLDESGNVVGRSVDPQLSGGYAPVESVWLRNPSSWAREVHVVIGRYAGTHVPEMDLFVGGTTPPRFRTLNRSLSEPATAPGAFAVGSVCAANGVVQPFSSAGPSADGRTKPDLVSYDAVSTFTYGSSRSTCQHGFAGTSASAPHVTGAAALIKAVHPTWGADKISEYLKANAADIGALGPDNGTGWGRMRLGDIAAAATKSYDPNGPAGTIYRLYRAYFLREPDSGGFDYWLATYASGYPLDKISNDFARSKEFQARYGSLDNRGFLDLVYRNVLGRAPDQGGYDYWLGQMNRGMLRGFVMIYFSDSQEFRSKTAAGRPPGYA